MGSPWVPTPSQTVGPFFGFALPFDDGAEAASGAGVVRIEGRLLDGEGAAVSDGLLEVWQGDQFARCRTDSEGAYHFTARKPQAAPGPDGTSPAPHLTLIIFARGLLRHLVTRMYFPDEEGANAADAVLAYVDPERRATLVAQDHGGILSFDIRLQGDGETVFFAV